jgi:hypothetical protein
MSQVIGLAWIKPTALHLVLRNKGYDARIYPGDTDWANHMAVPSKLKKVAVIEDKRYLKRALEEELPLIIVCVEDLDWMERRGIKCLDGFKEQGLTTQLEVTAKKKQLAITPAQIYAELSKADVYETSTTDIWLTKSNPKGRCAGCKNFEECGFEPTPTAKQPCGGKDWAPEGSPKSYRSHSLSQLIHLALSGADEAKLMDSPQTFWRSTYAFATGSMSRTEWITDHARMLKSAGANKVRLQSIVMWVKRYGPKLHAKKIGNPPSKLDVKLAEKLLK